LAVRIDRKTYLADGQRVVALENLEFAVNCREFVSLLGPSGCGKTTLLRLIAGLDLSYDGRICVDGTPIRGPGKRIGVVFQEVRLLPWLSVAQNIAFALPKQMPRAEREQRVDEVIGLVGLGGCRRAWPGELSGGMQKRVGLARALVNPPEILLMDEPFSALDVTSKFDLQDKVAEIHERAKLTTVLVTHDLDEAIYLSNRIALLSLPPATILKEYRISSARPRSRTSDEALALKAQIIGDILLTHMEATDVGKRRHVVA
jgi:sulfonate transport system ATP-binding protein